MQLPLSSDSKIKPKTKPNYKTSERTTKYEVMRIVRIQYLFGPSLYKIVPKVAQGCNLVPKALHVCIFDQNIIIQDFYPNAINSGFLLKLPSNFPPKYMQFL